MKALALSLFCAISSPAQSVLVTPSSGTILAGFGVYSRYQVDFTLQEGQSPAGIRFQLKYPENLPNRHFFEPVSTTSEKVSSFLNLAVLDTAPSGSYYPEVEAVQDTMEGSTIPYSSTLDSAKLTIEVRNFEISAAPPSSSIKRKSSAEYFVTIVPDPKLTANFYLVVSGLPKYATATFTPQNVDCAGGPVTATLKVTTKSNTPPGKYELAISPYYYSHTARVQLTVQ